MKNFLLASEIVSGYHKDKKPQRITIKIDIAKAFDSLRWDFILTCLVALQFPPIYTSWIKECITTTAYSVGFNGSIHGFFKGTRGSDRGILSPYIFGITINVLSQKLNKAAEDQKFGYHPKCKDSKLIYLCFADDLLIFSDGAPSSVHGILEMLSEFHQLSGLAISPEKSCFFASGLSSAEITSLVTTSGIPHGQLPIRYLGLPLCSKKLTLQDCEPLLQKIRGKISNWTAKFTSFAGRLQLLSSVISGIANFWCSSFILPNKCITMVNSMCSAYLWKGSL